MIMDIFIVDAKGTDIMPQVYAESARALEAAGKIVDRLQKRGCVYRMHRTYGPGSRLYFLSTPDGNDIFVSCRLTFLR